MFHGRPIFLPFSWPLGACDALLAKNASPCVAERLGVTSWCDLASKIKNAIRRTSHVARRCARSSTAAWGRRQ